MAEGLLAGKVALVTGAASGIGLATTRLLRSEGAQVAVVDLNPPPDGAADFYVNSDVGDSGSWPGVVREVEEALGGIDAAHLNAGVTTGEGDIEALSDDLYRRILHVNVDGVVFGTRALVPALKRRGGGALVATASIAGIIGMPSDPIYSLTKHAVVGFMRSLAPRLEAEGILMNTVNPGITNTPMVDDVREYLAAVEFPLLEPEDIARAVLLAMTSGRSGECWVCQPGREPEPYKFRGVPGPRTPGKEGMAPPSEVI